MTIVYRITARDMDRAPLPRTTQPRLCTTLEDAETTARNMAPTHRAKRGWTLEMKTRPGVEDRWYLEQRNSRGRLIFCAIIAKTVA